jgi:enolase
LLLKVN